MLLFAFLLHSPTKADKSKRGVQVRMDPVGRSPVKPSRGGAGVGRGAGRGPKLGFNSFLSTLKAIQVAAATHER